ncbi:hypothetical protein AMST5_01926 [freshwater sediment metagenome]|uniref:Arc-like DNA binding domain-containing protein n=1 Tax=freshwater sediment metagenome TaxID=556182 RepID=A0AA48LZ47_9ZZZZ
MAKPVPEFRLRLPEKLRAEIEEQAKKNQRSINSEILARLQNSLTLDAYDWEMIASDVEKLKDQVGRLRDDVDELSGRRRFDED